MKEPFSIIHLRKDVIFPAQKIISTESYFLKVWVFQLSLLDNTPKLLAYLGGSTLHGMG